MSLKDLWNSEPVVNPEEFELVKKALKLQVEANKHLLSRIEKLEQIVYQNGWESK